MSKPRGSEHTTLTETAALVVKELKKIPDVKMIAPGEISAATSSRSGKRYITIVYTRAGCELIITGQSVQNVAVHIQNPQVICPTLKQTKTLREFIFKERSRLPGE
jgi:hypothetical protein